MIRTSLRIFRLPEPYGKGLRYDYVDDGEMEDCYTEATEMVAWLNGEEASPEAVKYGLAICEGELGGRLNRIKPTPPIMQSLDLTLVSNDGVEIKASSAILRRLFQFFDDYLTEFPNEKRIEVPFPRDMIEPVLDRGPHRPYFLDDYFHCLSYFSPKDFLLYFTFNTRGTPEHRLREVVDRCSEEDRDCILMARGPSKLPRAKLDFLRDIFVSYCDVKNTISFFSDYPSYLAIVLIYCHRVEDSMTSFRDHLLATDFSLSGEVFELQRAEWLAQVIYEAITHCEEWNDTQRLLAMLGYESELFGTKALFVAAPYLARLAQYRRTNSVERCRRVANHVAFLLRLPTNVVMLELQR